MSPASEVEYLKSLVSQLNEKIKTLESAALEKVKPTPSPAEQLRMILVGPPGAGTFLYIHTQL